MKHARTRYCSRRFTGSSAPTSSIRWEKISRRKKTNFSATMDFSKLSIALRKSKRSSAFTIWPNSHQKHEEEQSSKLFEIARVFVRLDHVARLVVKGIT